jgi:hypothetical protein
LRGPSSRDLKEISASGALVAREVTDERSDKVWLEGVDHLLRPDRLRHGGTGAGREDDATRDVSLLMGRKTTVPSLSYLPESVRERKDLTLTEVSVDADSRAGGDDSSSLLLLHDRPDLLAALVGPSEMDGHDLVPVLLGHRLEALVSKDTGVGNENVDSLVGVEWSGKRSLDDGG